MSAATYADPVVQRDFERWMAKVNRPLSVAEQSGWRRFWDGGAICPPCQREHLRVFKHDDWRVPANYDTPIQPVDRCTRCRQTPLQVPVYAFQVTAVLEIFSRA